MNGWLFAYVLAGTGLTGLYGAGEVLGWETDPVTRVTMDPSVRQSPGGWRSWTFWHQGLHGGK
jgi:hypothetical protein